MSYSDKVTKLQKYLKICQEKLQINKRSCSAQFIKISKKHNFDFNGIIWEIPSRITKNSCTPLNILDSANNDTPEMEYQLKGIIQQVNLLTKGVKS